MALTQLDGTTQTLIEKDGSGGHKVAQASFDGGPLADTLRGNISSENLTSPANLTAAPTSGQKIVIDDIVVSADAAMRVDFIEETSGTVIVSAYLSASSPAQVTTRGKLKLDTAGKKLRAQSSASGNIRIMCLYHSEA